MTFADAMQVFKMARAFNEDLPDGMWDALDEMYGYFKESDRTEADKDQFAADVDEVCKDFGFPCFT